MLANDLVPYITSVWPERQLDAWLKQQADAIASKNPCHQYENDPVAYAYDILGVRLTRIQQEIAYLICKPPYKVLCRAGHSVGKSFLGAVLVNWWYDTFNPGFCLTTAPTERQVKDILWKEVRVLRSQAKDPKYRNGFVGPKIPRLESAPNHYAHGFTARDGDRFQGHHGDAVLILFDEATGVAPIFWQAMRTMLGGRRYAFLAIYNPTDQSSMAHQEEKASGYHPVVTMSCLDHPNIRAEILGKPPIVPNAITYGILKGMLDRWCTPIVREEKTTLDIELAQPRSFHVGGSPSDNLAPSLASPSLSAEQGDLSQIMPRRSDTGLSSLQNDHLIYRPGPIAEARLLGRWPTQAVNAVWPEYVIDNLITTEIPWDMLYRGPLQVGADIARFGDDFTAIHIRKGGTSLWHESHNGWSIAQTVGRLKTLAYEYCRKFANPGPLLANGRRAWDPEVIHHDKIPIVVDDDGVGGGVVDTGRIEKFNFIGVSSAARPVEPLDQDYPNVRSWLWFSMVELAMKGGCTWKVLARDCPGCIPDLREQLIGPLYTLDTRGRRVVEPKDDMKERTGRSPDDADAVNLAYYSVGSGQERILPGVKVA